MVKCIEHNQKGTEGGYGNLSLHGLKARAHRVAYCKHHGLTLNDIHGKVVRHTCDNPRCINPLHLLLGSHQDNSNDKVSRNRQTKGEDVNTSVLTEEDVRAIRKRHVPRCRINGARAIARLYGVTHATINAVIAGTTWAHLTEEYDDRQKHTSD